MILDPKKQAGERVKACSMHQKDAFFPQHISQNEVNTQKQQQITTSAFSNSSGQMPCKSGIIDPKQRCEMAQRTIRSACSLCTWVLSTTRGIIQNETAGKEESSWH